MRSSTRQAPRRVGPTQRVLGLITAMLLIDVVLLGVLSGGSPQLADAKVELAALIVAFAVVEWRVVHVQFRAEASSFSLYEVPLAIGLLYSSPASVVVAAGIGAAIGLLGGRRQPPLKVLFNAANLSLYAGMAALIVDRWPTDGQERLIWVSIVLAVALASAASFGLIVAAVSLTEGFPGLRRVAELLSFALIVSITNTTVGLTAAIILARDVYGLILLTVPGALLLSAFRMLTSEREQRERVEFLYRSTRRLNVGASESGLGTLLREARVMFRSEIGAVVLTDGDHVRLFHSTDADERSAVLDDPAALKLVTLALGALDQPMIVSTSGGNGPLCDLVRKVGGRDAMVAGLRAEDRDIGVLIIANRLGEVTSFTDNDLQVLEALARQSAFLMHSDRLEQALAELRELEQELAYQASHDSLTSLPNRAVFTESLHAAVESADPFSILFVDLDGFKAVNDRYGHAAGDAVLVEVAKRLTRLVRPLDTVSRFGGDEFAILVLDNANPRAVAERVVTSLGDPITIDQGEAVIGCSIGLVVGREGTDPELLLQDADAAMYQAKQAGKGVVIEFESHVAPAGVTRRNVLEEAIRREELELHYQPIIDLERRRIAGVEALVRWRSRTGELLMPTDFLAEVSRCGMAEAIDQWVLSKATEDLTTIWTIDPEVFVSVNLSQKLLTDGSVVDVLSVPELDQARGRLVIEWPEAVLIAEMDSSSTTLDTIRDLGFLVALDRFGDGHASLTYLQRLPIDLLKIGPGMTSLATSDDQASDLLGGLIQITHSLGARVVAQGIERPRQLEALNRTRCDLAQGFLFARPMPIDALRPHIMSVASPARLSSAPVSREFT